MIHWLSQPLKWFGDFLDLLLDVPKAFGLPEPGVDSSFAHWIAWWVARSFQVVPLTILFGVIIPSAYMMEVGEWCWDHMQNPWRIEQFREGKWRDLKGHDCISAAMEEVTTYKRGEGYASYRIRYGRTIIPADIL